MGLANGARHISTQPNLPPFWIEAVELQTITAQPTPATRLANLADSVYEHPAAFDLLTFARKRSISLSLAGLSSAMRFKIGFRKRP